MALKKDWKDMVGNRVGRKARKKERKKEGIMRWDTTKKKNDWKVDKKDGKGGRKGWKDMNKGKEG